MSVTLTLLPLLTLLPRTWANDGLLVHADGADAAEAAARAGQSGALQVQDWTTFRAGHAAVVTGDAVATPCAGQLNASAEVSRHHGRAESSLNYLEYDTALGHLRAADRASGCASDPVAPRLLAQTSFLEGVIRFAQGDVPAARQAWRKALVFDPTFDWDPNIEPSGRADFDDVRKNLSYEAQSRIELRPAAGASVYVNGAPVTGASLDLPGGRSLFQSVGERADVMWLELTPGGRATVYVPGQLPDDLGVVLADAAGRAMLGEVLGATEPATAFTLVAGDAAWTTTGGKGWSQVADVRAATAPKRTAAQRTRRVVSWSAAGALLAGSGAAYLVAYDARTELYARGTALEDVTPLAQRTNAAFFTAMGLGAAALAGVSIGIP